MGILRDNVLAASGYVPGEQPVDLGVVKLNTNENPYPPSPRVLEAIGSVTGEMLRRYPSPNGRVFREAVAGVLGVGADWVLPFNGGDEVLSVAIRAAAGETDGVAFLEPSYSLYPVLTEMNGSKAVRLQYYIEGARWTLPEGIEKVDAKVLLLVNPNAPSGHAESLETLRGIASGFKGLFVIDEAYVDFASGSALELVREFSNVLILRTMSKGYSMAGMRLGFAVGQPGLLREIEKVRDSYPVDAVSIVAGAAAMLDQDYVRGTWEKVKLERGRLSGELKKMKFIMPESQANFLFPTVPVGGRLGKEFYERLKGRGVFVRWWDLPRIADKIRVTVGTAEQNDRLLAELRTML